MGKITGPLDVSNVTAWEELRRQSAINFDSIITQINGEISFDENVNAALVSREFTAANQELRFDHTLKRVADNYIICKSSAAATLFDGTNKNIENATYIRCSVASKVTVLIF